LDAKKILNLSQRPKPLGAVGIGTWLPILEILGFISIITNTIIVVFDTEIVQGWASHSAIAMAWTFFVIEHIIGIVKVCIAYAVDDVPANIRDHLERQKHVVDVLINDIPEEDEEIRGIEDIDQNFASHWTYDTVAKDGPRSRNPREDNKSSDV